MVILITHIILQQLIVVKEKYYLNVNRVQNIGRNGYYLRVDKVDVLSSLMMMHMIVELKLLVRNDLSLVHLTVMMHPFI